MARLRLFALIASAALFGSIPLIAVVGHRAYLVETHPAFSPEAVHHLVLMDSEGSRIAHCDMVDDDGTFTDCHLDNGSTIDDLMNAWAHAYQDIQSR